MQKITLQCRRPSLTAAKFEKIQNKTIYAIKR